MVPTAERYFHSIVEIARNIPEKVTSYAQRLRENINLKNVIISGAGLLVGGSVAGKVVGDLIGVKLVEITDLVFAIDLVATAAAGVVLHKWGRKRFI